MKVIEKVTKGGIVTPSNKSMESEEIIELKDKDGTPIRYNDGSTMVSVRITCEKGGSIKVSWLHYPVELMMEGEFGRTIITDYGLIIPNREEDSIRFREGYFENICRNINKVMAMFRAWLYRRKG